VRPFSASQLNILISNLGGGSPITNIAAVPTGPSAEMSPILPNVKPALTIMTTFPT